MWRYSETETTQRSGEHNHEQQPCPGCAAGWLTRTESGAAPPVEALSACESIRRVLISLSRNKLSERLKISREAYLANEKKASSTPSFTFADVSMNLIPSSLARALPCSSVTARLSVQSDLLPMRILFTPSDACCSILECQVRMSGM